MRERRRSPLPRTSLAGALLLSAASLVPAHPAGAQAVELRWGFEPGAEHLYRVVQEAETVVPGAETVQHQSLVMRKEVLEVGNDGTADLRVTYESVRHRQEGPMGVQEYDSEADDPPEAGPLAALPVLVGRSFEMTLSPSGEVRAVRGTDDFIEEMVDALGGAAPDEAAAERARQALEATFGEEGLAALLDQGMQSLPADPVAPGEEWSEVVGVQSPLGTIDSEYRYTLERVAEEAGSRVAVVSVEGTIGEMEPDPAGPMAEMADLVEASGGEMAGELRFDVDRGLLVWSVVEGTTRMELMGQELEVTTHHEMELIEG